LRPSFTIASRIAKKTIRSENRYNGYGDLSWRKGGFVTLHIYGQ